MSRRGPRRLALALVVFGSALVLAPAFNPAPHTGGDNAAYLSLAHALVTEGAYVDAFDPQQAPHAKYPPVFPALLAVLMALGARTWTAFKLIPALATVAAVGLTYLWATRRLGLRGGVLATGMFAVSSTVIYYSHWILSDPVFVAFTLLALWLLEREGTSWPTLAAGAAAVGLAYFTRSAGLPLLVALLAWLALQRRWRAVAGVGAGLGVPALLWWMRGRGVQVGDYVSEFWMVNPYDPSLGTVGPAGLLGRAAENLVAYLTRHGPGGVIGLDEGPLAAGFGMVLVALAVVGWWREVRRDLRPAELFLPLYTGLILLWPQVWSGDRFLLPLYPLAFVYAVLGFRWLTEGRVGGRPRTVLAALLVLFVVGPALLSWRVRVQEASYCQRAVRASGPWGCYHSGVQDFAEAAVWLGSAAPEGSVALTRKPRIFYVLSGLRSRTFPFSEDPAEHLALADRVGARYVILDRWDGLASRYVGEALRRHPGAFCAVRRFGAEETPTYLLGIRAPGERGLPAAADPEAIHVRGCPAGMVDETAAARAQTSSASMRIPLLAGLDP